MSRYSEINSMLKGQPVPKPPTIGVSVRIPVRLASNVIAMANRANVSRNEMICKLLDAAVQAAFDSLVDTNDTDAVSEIQEEADILAATHFESSEHQDHEDQE